MQLDKRALHWRILFLAPLALEARAADAVAEEVVGRPGAIAGDVLAGEPEGTGWPYQRREEEADKIQFTMHLDHGGKGSSRPRTENVLAQIRPTLTTFMSPSPCFMLLP